MGYYLTVVQIEKRVALFQAKVKHYLKMNLVKE